MLRSTVKFQFSKTQGFQVSYVSIRPLRFEDSEPLSARLSLKERHFKFQCDMDNFRRPVRAIINLMVGSSCPGRTRSVLAFQSRCFTLTHARRSVADLSTIYALGTARGRSAISVVRISGSETDRILKTLCQSQVSLAPRRALLRKLYDPDSESAIIDQGIVLYFPEPHSYTGEDVGELHVHGSLAVITALLTSLSKFRNCRPAERGEFSRRALLNAKLDLTHAEAIADLIAAETDAQRKQALNSIHSRDSLHEKYQLWTDCLLRACAHLDAVIDFGEDEDFHADVGLIEQNVLQNVRRVEDEITQHLQHYDVARKIRTGFMVTLVGAPNAGKSSIINRCVRRQASIVSPIPGTTRDIVESFCELGGYPVVFSDTAGVRMMSSPNDTIAAVAIDPIEAEGINRAISRAKESDIIVYVLDADKCKASELKKFFADPFDVARRKLIECGVLDNENSTTNATLIPVVNKADLLPHDFDYTVNNNNIVNGAVVLSCKTDQGFVQLNEALARALTKISDRPRGCAVVTRQRQRDLLVQALNHIEMFRVYFDEDADRKSRGSRVGKRNSSVNVDELEEPSVRDVVLAANELRLVLDQLAKLVGKGSVSVDELLDKVFSDFCIGK